MLLNRISPLLRRRFFTTSARSRNAISIDDAVAAQLTSTSSNVPKLGKIGRWYLPTMVAIALGMIYIPKQFYLQDSSLPGRRKTLMDANRHIGFGIQNALNDANRKVHLAIEPTQEQRNMMLMESYGERSSLEDMERAIARLDAKLMSKKNQSKVLEDAYGERKSIKDLERAMRIYEVQ